MCIFTFATEHTTDTINRDHNDPNLRKELVISNALDVRNVVPIKFDPA